MMDVEDGAMGGVCLPAPPAFVKMTERSVAIRHKHD